MTSIQQALQQYNAHFDNQKYQMIANHLVQDLRAERESLTVSDAMNLVSDVAFQVVQHPHDFGLCEIIKVADLVQQDRTTLGPRQNRRRSVDPLKIGPAGRDERQRASIRKVMHRTPDQRLARPACGFVCCPNR